MREVTTQVAVERAREVREVAGGPAEGTVQVAHVARVAVGVAPHAGDVAGQVGDVAADVGRAVHALPRLTAAVATHLTAEVGGVAREAVGVGAREGLALARVDRGLFGRGVGDLLRRLLLGRGELDQLGAGDGLDRGLEVGVGAAAHEGGEQDGGQDVANGQGSSPGCSDRHVVVNGSSLIAQKLPFVKRKQPLFA